MNDSGIIVRLLPFSGGLFLVHSNYVSYYSPKDNNVSIKYEHDTTFSFAASISSSNHLAICDVNKKVFLFLIDPPSCSLRLLHSGGIEKSAMACCFQQDGKVLVGDKFGDIHRFGDAWKGEVIAGCVSMTTDLDVNKDSILMADRDEKIRLIRIDKPWVIEQFYLHHTEYVSAAKFISSDRFISIAGDGKLLVWDISIPAKPVQTVEVDLKPFDPVCLALSQDRGAFVLEGHPSLFLFKVNADFTITEPFRVNFSNEMKANCVSFLEGLLYISGIDRDGKPVLAKYDCDNDNFSMIDCIAQHLNSLESIKSLQWSQVVRSHLRKRQYPPRKKANNIRGNDINVEVASDNSEGESE